ncbi:sensor histidine kinase [Jiangella muralis]|uniref:sensor histidine kinase n=1 Tax=Jiangella muralis TaxID=702383 RepID=UPI00069D5138|nr:ATP-binding protein [Jiangella muralis]
MVELQVHLPAARSPGRDPRLGGGQVGALDDGRVRFEVDDSGPGVPEDRRTRIFDRFARDGVSGGRGGRGVGLGLAIVAQHVRWHGGTVTVLDRPGGGARFVVDLPVVRSSSAALGLP